MCWTPLIVLSLSLKLMLEKVYLYHLERSKLKLPRILFLMLWRFSWVLHECLIHECKIICLAKVLNNYLLFVVSSSNTYTKTFIGIDGAGKRLADEVSPETCKFMYLKLARPILVLIAVNLSQIVSCWMIMAFHQNRSCKLLKRQRAWKESPF